MAITSSTLQSAQNGTIWARNVGGTTYFLRKINNSYEVWVSGSNEHSPVTLSQAVTYANQYNLVNTNTATAAPIKPPVSPKKTVSPTTGTSTPAKTPAKPVKSPPTTTNPSNTLPLGDAIQDIYDPNLTPEQIASLSPGDQKARAAYLKDHAPFTGPNEDIVVTASKPSDYAAIYSAESQATQQDQANFEAKEDWRVRLTLAPNAKYLYNSDNPGILKPLNSSTGTDGVIFPYTPNIAVNYVASYNPAEIVHSNYKVFQYSNSSVEQVTITCDFTAQDTHEANYLLAVIHFFRTMTKMFYGQDSSPKNGTPPPLCYMFGMGGYQFAAHPLAISGFSYNLPSDVDYIKTTSTSIAGDPVKASATTDVSSNRLAGTNVTKGGTKPGPVWSQTAVSETTTWVPTKINIAINCLPIMSRNLISNQFSLEKYADGTLLLGSKRPGGGMW